GSVLFSINESPLEEGVIWVGTNDGQVQITRDGGTTWTNVTENIRDLPAWGTIANIEASRYEAGTAYISVDLHQMGDFDPYVYKATEYGRRFEKISDGIPQSILSFVHVVREDPERMGMLYVGTDNAVYVSLDDGDNWSQLQSGMPSAPVYWLTVQEGFGDLVVATYGRGFYILDDISPLRNTTAETLRSSEPVLFEPRAAYRFIQTQGTRSEPNGLSTGRNPPYGASIHFVAGQAQGSATVEIVDDGGETIRTLSHTIRPGINRIWWNLRHEDPRTARLRVAPPGKPFVEFNDEGWREVRTWDLDLVGGQRGPLAKPGQYTVRLTIADETLEQRLTVLKDPHSSGTLADIDAQLDRALQIRDEINEIVDMIDELEWVRSQLEGLETRYGADSALGDLMTATDSLEQAAMAVEGRLYDIHLTGAREDAFRSPMKLYGRLSALASDLSANGADFSPTSQQVEVHQILQERLEEARRLFELLMSHDVPQFQRLIRELNLPDIISYNFR
ncbi:MAG: glycosyl hydrolase, partial [Gemmatimonadota bacterium]|nr:glycosyl hydrolase [Gemmatimonadota bacterium]